MTAPTLTETEVIAEGRAVLARLAADDFAWPSDGRECASIRDIKDGLADAIETYEEILGDRRHPVSEFPELARDGEAYDTALRKVADDVRSWTGVAAEVLPSLAETEEAA